MLRGAGEKGDRIVSQYSEGVKPDIETLGKGRLNGEPKTGDVRASDRELRESNNIC